MKQTAVEWLIEQLEKDSDVIFYERNLHPFEEYVKQAKAMEKEQKDKQYARGFKDGQNHIKIIYNL